MGGFIARGSALGGEGGGTFDRGIWGLYGGYIGDI